MALGAGEVSYQRLVWPVSRSVSIPDVTTTSMFDKRVQGFIDSSPHIPLNGAISHIPST